MGADFVATRDLGVDAKGGPDSDLDTRERLVRAAIEVFLEKGYGGTRVQDIARRAGFTSGALYVHFPSRTALLGEAIIREGQTIMTNLADQIGAVSDGPGAIVQLLGDLGAGEPTNLDLLLLEALALASRSDDAKAVLTGAIDGLVEVIMDRIASARTRGAVSSEIDGDALRQVMVAWIFGGVAVKALALGTASRPALDDVTSRLLGGLAADS